MNRNAATQLRVLTSLVAALGAACFHRWGKDLGNGALNTARDRGPEIVGVLVQAYKDSVRPRLDSTVVEFVDTIQTRVAGAEDSTASFVRTKLDSALRELVSHSLVILRDSVRRSLNVWLDDVSQHGRTNIVPLAGEVADSATSRAVSSLNAGLTGPLRTTVLKLVMEIADSVRVAARRTVQEPAFKAILSRLGVTGGLVAGGVIAAVIAGLAIMAINLRRTHRALGAVTSAVHDHGSSELRGAVRDQALARNVEGWLHNYLAKRDLLQR